MPTFKMLNFVLLFSVYAKMAHKVLAN